MSAGTPFALMAASSEGRAESSTAPHAEGVPESKAPLFPDDAEFWYETRGVHLVHRPTEQANLAKC